MKDVSLCMRGNCVAVLAATAVFSFTPVYAQDECSDATEIYIGINDFSTTDATNSSDPWPDGACDAFPGEMNQDIWLSFSPAESGGYSFSTCNASSFDTDLAVYGGDCENQDQLACSGDGAGLDGCQAYYSYIPEVELFAGSAYLVRIGGWDAAAFGDGTIEIAFNGEILPGSCCIGEDCYEGIFEAECAANGGLYQGDGTDCSDPDVCVVVPLCDDPGSMTYPADDIGAMADGGVACAGGGLNAGNSWAVTLPASDIADGDLSLSCLTFGFSNAGSAFEASLNVYIDTNGGAPTSPATDLDLLASVEFLLPTSAGGETLQVGFPDGPATIPAGSQIVVDLTVPASDGWVDYWENGVWHLGGEVYILSDACGLPEYQPLSAIGFPGEYWTVALHGEFSDDPPPPDCPADVDGSGEVGFSDLLSVLANWGNAGGPEDVDGNGSVDFADLLAVLASWGPC